MALPGRGWNRAWLCMAWFCLAGLGLLALLPASLAHAQEQGESRQFGDSLIQDVSLLYAPGDGLYLSASSVLVLPQNVSDALQQGIPMYFVAEARLTRPRWWLLSRQDARAQRFWRLGYQPLTRRWRLQSSAISSEHTDQLGLAQTFDSLAAALAAMQRISGWKIADAARLRPAADYTLEFSFGLDRSRIPRPLQISEIGRAFWDLQLHWRRPFRAPD